MQHKPHAEPDVSDARMLLPGTAGNDQHSPMHRSTVLELSLLMPKLVPASSSAAQYHALLHHSWLVTPGVHGQVPHGNRGAVCRVGHTHDGMYMCVGNGQGDTYVYDALDGSLVTHLRPRKV